MRASETRETATTVGRWTVKVPTTESRYASEAVDDRRNRKYGRKVAVHVKATDLPTLPDDELPYGAELPRTEHALHEALTEALGKSVVKEVRT